MSGALNRRQAVFCLAASPAWAGCVNATGSAFAVRPPISSVSNPALLMAVYAAWAEFSRKDPSHPWSREGQRRIHEEACTAHQAMNHDVSKPDFHNTWDFLPWHRCFVHFHERVLIELARPMVANADRFRLPYWDWDRRPIVPAFYDDARFAVPVAHTSGAPISGCASPDNLRAMLSPASFAGADGFGGTPSDQGSACSTRPHSGIHMTVSEPMSLPATAPNDPLFFVHHANIDRLWEIWSRQNGGNPFKGASPALLNTTYTFPGRTPNTCVSYRVGDIGNTAALGYTYADYDCGVSFTSPNYPLSTRTGLIGGVVQLTTEAGTVLNQLLTNFPASVPGIFEFLGRLRRMITNDANRIAEVYLTSQMRLPFSNRYTFFLWNLRSTYRLGTVFMFNSPEPNTFVRGTFAIPASAALEYLVSGSQLLFKPEETDDSRNALAVPLDSRVFVSARVHIVTR